jgi:hypothetical protein
MPDGTPPSATSPVHKIPTDGARPGAAYGLGAPRAADQRADRQPGAQPTQAAGDWIVQCTRAQRDVLGRSQRHRRLSCDGFSPVPTGSYAGTRRVSDTAREGVRRNAAAVNQLGLCHLRRGDARARRGRCISAAVSISRNRCRLGRVSSRRMCSRTRCHAPN